MVLPRISCASQHCRNLILPPIKANHADNILAMTRLNLCVSTNLGDLLRIASNDSLALCLVVFASFA